MSGTAQVIGNIIAAGAASGDGGWLSVVKYIIAGMAALASPFVLQELAEYVIAVFKVPFFVKPFVPKILATIVAGILNWTGLDGATSAGAGVALMGMVKLANESKWALDLENKVVASTAGTPSQRLVDAAKNLVEAGKVLQASPGQVVAQNAHNDAMNAVLSAIPKVLVLGLLLLGASLKADVTPTAFTGWLSGPSTFVTGAEYQMQTDGSLTPTAEAVFGGQYGFYLGSFTQSKAGKVQFDPLAYLGFGIGISSGTGDTRPVGMVSVGYRDFGISASWNLGQGREMPLVGIQATIPFMSIIPGLDWDMSHTVSTNMPGATW